MSDIQLSVKKKEDKKLTGKPSIDKPHLKYYAKKAKDGDLPYMSIYDYFYMNNFRHKKDVGLVYFDHQITFKEMFDQIEAVARSFKKLGVKAGDVVMLCMPSTPETIYCFYALNMIGAITNFIDPRTSAEGIKLYLNEGNARFLIMVDLAYGKIKMVLDDTRIEMVITVSTVESLPRTMKTAYRTKNLIKSRLHYIADTRWTKKWGKVSLNDGSEKEEKQHRRNVLSRFIDAYWKTLYNLAENNRDTALQHLFYDEKHNDDFITWPEFIAIGKEYRRDLPASRYKKNRPAVIIHTGGTTGSPKGVILSDDALNAMAFQYKYCGIKVQRQQRFLDIMPPFIAYGLVNGIHMPLCLGMTVVLVPQFDANDLPDLLVKYKVAVFMGVGTFYESLMHRRKLDLSNLICPGAGGDMTHTELEKRINACLEKFHCHSKLANGYGMTEYASAVAACVNPKCYKLGSVGIPLSKNVIAAFDMDTGEELSYGEVGELCIQSPTQMIGYYHNSEETERVLKRHRDGKIWGHTGDLGYVDEDGCIFIVGRAKRMIIRPDGHNVYPLTLEDTLLQIDAVQDCSVVGVKSAHDPQGEYPKACIVLKKSSRGKEREIQKVLEEHCNSLLPERDVPYYYEFLEELPMTSIGKVDYRRLEFSGTENAYTAKVKISAISDIKVKVKKSGQRKTRKKTA